jgi:hypothetical protein
VCVLARALYLATRHATCDMRYATCDMRHLRVCVRVCVCVFIGLLIRQSQPVTVGSVRIYGDHEFVRSTENLIRVHIELHHSSYIDSTDFREQMVC